MSYLKIFAYLLMTVAFSISVIGQSRKVTEKEIDELVANALVARIGTSYRETTSTLAYTNNNKPERISHSVADWESGGNSHIVVESHNYDGRKFKIETITLGKYKYTRLEGRDWVIEDLKAPNAKSINDSESGNGSGSPSVPSVVELKFNYVGTEKIGDIRAEVYQKLKTITFTDEKGKLVKTVTRKYWFDKQKRLIKHIEEDKLKGSSKFYRYMYEYDYQTPIKIEAPIK